MGKLNATSTKKCYQGPTSDLVSIFFRVCWGRQNKKCWCKQLIHFCSCVIFSALFWGLMGAIKNWSITCFWLFFSIYALRREMKMMFDLRPISMRAAASQVQRPSKSPNHREEQQRRRKCWMKSNEWQMRIGFFRLFFIFCHCLEQSHRDAIISCSESRNNLTEYRLKMHIVRVHHFF